MGRPKNAVERRIEELAILWNEFVTNPELRLLRWLGDDETLRYVELFLEVQRNGGGDIPDLFVLFDIPLDNPQDYAHLLVQSLQRQLEESRDELSNAGLDTAWKPPEDLSAEKFKDAQWFVDVCSSFQSHYSDLMEHLAVALTPTTISSPLAWSDWLLGLIQTKNSEHMRFIVLDELPTPILEELAAEETQRVFTVLLQDTTPEQSPFEVSVSRDLNIPGVYTELANEAEGSGPGHTFRRHFVALSNAATRNDLTEAKKAGQAALAIAEEHNWSHLQVTIYMALGATYLGAKQIHDTLEAYRKATQVAIEAVKQEDPVGASLVIPPRFAEGSVLVSEKKFVEAATVYEESAKFALDHEDQLTPGHGYRMAIEGWRMASYCHQQQQSWENAWECAQNALVVGETLKKVSEKKDKEKKESEAGSETSTIHNEVDKKTVDYKEVIENSTLHYVGQILLRLCKRSQFRKYTDEIRQRMENLVGPDWEKRLDQEAGKS